MHAAFFAGFAAWLAVGTAAGQSSSEAVTNADAGTARAGSFTQVMRVAGDPRRWVYEGDYRFSPEGGLTWTIVSPIEGSLEIDREGEARADGDLGGMGVMARRTVARLVYAMVAMDRDVLGRYYYIHESRDADGFEIVLEARENWRRQAGTVTMRGREQVDSVHFEFDDGRIMEIELDHG